MTLFLAVSNVFTQQQTERLGDGIVTFILVLLVTLGGFIAFKVDRIRAGQLRREAREEAREKDAMEGNGYIHKRSSDEREMAEGEVRNVQKEDLRGYEFQKDHISELRRDNSPELLLPKEVTHEADSLGINSDYRI